jgi:hypothetical protein
VVVPFKVLNVESYNCIDPQHIGARMTAAELQVGYVPRTKGSSYENNSLKIKHLDSSL